MSQTDEIATFVRTADLGSFVAVAIEVGLTASAVARTVSRLERRLGIKLQHRSTRRLVLTQEGEAYLHHARAIVAAIDAANAEIAAGLGRPKGLIRVSTGTAFAKHRLVRLLPQFQALYPDIMIDLAVSDRRVDPEADQIDITIRVGPLQDSQHILHPMGTVRRVIAASPDYLARRGVPQCPLDILAHNCLLLNGFARLAQWPMFENGKRVLLPVRGSVRSDSADVLHDLALADVGIVRVGDFLGEQALADGRLVSILASCHDDDPTPLSALILPGGQNIARVKAFIPFLKTAAGRSAEVLTRYSRQSDGIA